MPDATIHPNHKVEKLVSVKL